MNKIISPTITRMLELARSAMTHAYSPYSKFKVGACIRTKNNNFYVGCNYENASYSLTQCAEANAIGAMVTAGETEIAEVVIIGSSNVPCTACGACRQRIREFATPEISIHMFSSTNDYLTLTLDELLPASFGPQLNNTESTS